MDLDTTRLHVPNGHEADALDVEVLVHRQHQRCVGVGLQNGLYFVHQGVHSLSKMDAIVCLKGPIGQTRLVEEHLHLRLVHPLTLGRVDDGQTPGDAGARKRNEHLAEVGINGGKLHDSSLRSGQCVEKGGKALGVLGGSDEGENAGAVGPVFLVNIGVNVSLVGGFCNALCEVVGPDDGDVQHDHARSSWPGLKNQWVFRIRASPSVRACWLGWILPSPIRPVARRSPA